MFYRCTFCLSIQTLLSHIADRRPVRNISAIGSYMCHEKNKSDIFPTTFLILQGESKSAKLGVDFRPQLHSKS